ncbi:hypothetical protein KI387_022701 [Taxus chinensis]|uniref:Uncharacterized protein n=1 Tax=Taxus chinensis TaxID=29808 RepID=A0AA38L654_TAXCH|nr:hypothetical protein KI387_022701 [Taxus chinensis]
MGVCLSRPEDNYPLVSANEFGNDMKQTMDDETSRVEIEARKHKPNSVVPDKFQSKMKNSEDHKMSEDSPVPDCKREEEKNPIYRFYNAMEEKMVGHEHLKTRSKSSSSCSADFTWDLALDFHISKKFSGPCQTMEKDADFDEILFGYKTGEILDFFREYSSAETVSTHPKLQKLKSLRLFRLSMSSRFSSNSSEKITGLLMKNLSSKSKPKCSNDESNVSDKKSGYDCNSKSKRGLFQVHKNNKAGRRKCLLSMFNVDRSFNIGDAIETSVIIDHAENPPGVINGFNGGSHVDFGVPVKTLSNDFVLLNFCPNDGGNGSTEPDKTAGSTEMFDEATERRDLEFQSVQELQGSCRVMAGEEAAFGSPFSIGRGRRSKGRELSENLMSGRISADAFSDSSSDLFDLEFLNHQ